jgi:hypothetical protein
MIKIMFRHQPQSTSFSAFPLLPTFADCEVQKTKKRKLSSNICTEIAQYDELCEAAAMRSEIPPAHPFDEDNPTLREVGNRRWNSFNKSLRSYCQTPS